MNNNQFRERILLTGYLLTLSILILLFANDVASTAIAQTYQTLLFTLPLPVLAVAVIVWRGGFTLQQVMQTLTTLPLYRPILLVCIGIHAILPAILTLFVVQLRFTPSADMMTVLQWIWMIIAYTLLGIVIANRFSFIDVPTLSQLDLKPLLERSDISNRYLAVFIMLTFLMGFVVGILHPNLHVAVEQGQIIAGTVTYEPGNPWYIYQAKTWNIWAQISGLGLALGFSVSSISSFISGLIGAIYMVAIATLILATTHKPKLAFITPFILLSMTFLGALSTGYGYPVILIDTRNTYGMVGLSFITLIVAFFMLRRETIAFCLLGLSLMVHASLSVWLHLVLLIYILSDFRNFFLWFKRGLPAIPFYVLSLVSLFWQRANFQYPPLEPDVASQFLDVILANWSVHGDYIIQMKTAEGMFLVYIFVVCVVLLLSGLRSVYSIRFLVLTLLITLFVGVGGHLFSRLPIELANTVAILLPNRLLNLLLITTLSIIIAGGIGLVSYGLYRGLIHLQPVKTLLSGHRLQRLAWGLVILFIGVTFWNYQQGFNDRYNQAYRVLESPVFAETAKRTDLILISPVGRGTQEFQLITNRPLVLNPLVDGHLPYTVEAGPATADIFERIYYVDFFNPQGRLKDIGRQIANQWKDRTTEEWIALANEFGFSQVLMIADTPLQLPVVVHDPSTYTLYEIPDQ